MKRLFRFEWDALAGILTAVSAIILHYFHIVDTSVLLSVTVVLIALLFLRDLRRDDTFEQFSESLLKTHNAVKEIQADIIPSDIILVGPSRLRQVTKDFSTRAQGEMIWFHVCPLMFKRQELFDLLLRPAIENEQVKSIQFIFDEGQRQQWESEMLPKINACRNKEKVNEPHWTSIEENVSVIISNIGLDKKVEVLLSFWGEPFMSKTVGRQVPRYIFHLLPNSELIAPLAEMVRHYRIG